MMKMIQVSNQPTMNDMIIIIQLRFIVYIQRAPSFFLLTTITTKYLHRILLKAIIMHACSYVCI